MPQGVQWAGHTAFERGHGRWERRVGRSRFTHLWTSGVTAKIAAQRGAAGRGALVAGARAQAARRRAVRQIANQRVGGFLGIELKFLDCAWNGVALVAPTDWTGAELQPSSGCTNALSVPAQAVTEQARDGRRYTLKSCFVTGTIDFAPSMDDDDAEQSIVVFLALVHDKQTNGAAIDSEKVYLNNSNSALVATSPLRNLQFSTRFNVLATATLECGMNSFNDATGAAGTASGTQIPECRMPFKLSWTGDQRVECTNTTADVASVADHSFHLIGVAQSTVYTPKVYAQSRCRFVG